MPAALTTDAAPSVVDNLPGTLAACDSSQREPVRFAQEISSETRPGQVRTLSEDEPKRSRSIAWSDPSDCDPHLSRKKTAALQPLLLFHGIGFNSLSTGQIETCCLDTNGSPGKK